MKNKCVVLKRLTEWWGENAAQSHGENQNVVIYA